MRTLPLALALLAAPAFAQSAPVRPVSSPPQAVAASDIDAGIVGTWRLDEVVAGGHLGELGVEVTEMQCSFGAEGTARVKMDMVQDLDPMSRERTFEYETDDGHIVVSDDDDVSYQILEDGRLELTTAGGLVVRLRASTL